MPTSSDEFRRVPIDKILDALEIILFFNRRYLVTRLRLLTHLFDFFIHIDGIIGFVDRQIKSTKTTNISIYVKHYCQ